MAEPFTYGGQTIISHPVFVESILPFLLIFTIVFAILQKSEVLGKDKKQIDAIVALVVGLLVISFAQAIGIILQLIPFMAVSLVVLLILFILLGSWMKIDEVPKGIQYVLMAVVIIAVVVAVMYFTGAWYWVMDLIYGGIGESEVFTNAIFILIIAAAVAAVVWKGGGSSS